jgi:holo-[acyl-carrier protein] synthase
MTDVRIGVDLASVDAVAASIARFGPRYTDRLFTLQELRDAEGTLSARASSLAARFAAKEATLKALGVGDDVPSWTDIEVRRVPGGGCSLQLSGRAAILAREARLDRWSVSMTHEGCMAAAVVVAVGPDGAENGQGG